jgi:DNA-binding NarL/FixJ family response regulator
VLVDGEQMTRTAVAQMLTAGGIQVVGETANGEDAIELVLDLRPDVVLTGISLPGISGVEVIERLSLLAPASRVLVLTSGYILKTAPPEAVVNAVRATAAGESVLSSQIAGQLLDRIRERDIPVTASSKIAAGAIRAALTERELEIFQRLASGESNQQIGRELTLSTNTISNHIKSILAKLQLDNRIQAAVHAVRSGIS